MLPYWEAHASFGDERTENAAQVLHVLAVEYANWARHHRDTSGAEGEDEMRELTDMARETFDKKPRPTTRTS